LKQLDFTLKNYDQDLLSSGSYTWRSPSNIALIKYWGKHGEQLPKNTSLSFTLDACCTTTSLGFERKKEQSSGLATYKNDFDFSIFFEGAEKEAFKPKINTFFKRIERYVPFIKEYTFNIETSNTFPHSSGIASSASGMSALALCLMSMEKEICKTPIDDNYFYKKASFLARLGSGSACRSIKGPMVVWGNNETIKSSSDDYGVKLPLELHTNFKEYQDTILLVDEGEKHVSSTVGHELMHQHPFAEKRFEQANDNFALLVAVLQNGDLKEFVRIVETEALSLHAMMMTSNPYFLLMKPNTLKIIHAIWNFRKKTGLQACFTLDAGANVHLLYPKAIAQEVSKLITDELASYCNNRYIWDQAGLGAIQITS
jgi:diphosphomevalonate decarboxylase